MSAGVSLPSRVQLQSLDFIEQVICEHTSPKGLLAPEEAVDALLGLRRPYEGGAAMGLGSYDAALLSVPCVGSHPVDLVARLPEEARKLLVAFDENVVLTKRFRVGP